MFIVTLLLFRTLRHEGSGVDKACVDRLSPDLAASFSVSGALGFWKQGRKARGISPSFFFFSARLGLRPTGSWVRSHYTGSGTVS